MNRPIKLTDEAVITRLRRALDEVAAAATELGNDAPPNASGGAGASGDAGRTEPFQVVTRRPAGRATRGRTTTLLGVAATCTALVGGALVALSQRAPSPTDLAADPPDATVFVPATAVPAAGEPWFTLAAANLAHGAITRPPQFPSDGEPLFQAWSVVGDSGSGFLFATIYADRPGDQPEAAAGVAVEEVASGVPDGRAWLVTPAPQVDAPARGSLWWSRPDGSVWVFDEQGLSNTPRLNGWFDLAFDAQPGSGVPIVLPDTSATLISVGVTARTIVTQRFTGTSAGPSIGAADLTVSDGAAAPTALIGATTVTPVTVAGAPGWKGVFPDGHVAVVWPVGNGWWGLLGISPELAAQADSIITGIARVDTAIPATPVAPPADAQEYLVVGGIVELSPGQFVVEVPTADESVAALSLRGFSWDVVADEPVGEGGVVRTGLYALVVRAYADRTAEFVSITGPSAVNEPRDPCVYDNGPDPFDALNDIDVTSLGVVGYDAQLNSDGTCDRLVVWAYVDTPELRTTLDPLADQVELQFLLTPL